MNRYNSFRLRAISVALVIISVNFLVNSQISTPCTTSMISSFTPCVNFITGSTGNGSSPTSGCCDSLRSLMGTSIDCACLVITANVPFQLPINRTLSLSLPRACNMGGMPVQCKASGSPPPAPGPAILGPNSRSLPPTAASPLTPRASKAVAAVPKSETAMDLTPESPPMESEAPTTNQGIRPVLTPSAFAPSYISLSPLFLVLIGTMVLKSY
ncbi:Non-specific lipid-transfer protein-like protein [Quillaja saponaria]|uniref:Non-specific lipid-transfer protein-like protein n=1 Tax=Quillaja saponaria TaxID=32244 RepID=A0AAD7Q9E5_QUISA|nr:Non-specific lipid-transfer protein-like protein [Quillaja saponaria]